MSPLSVGLKCIDVLDADSGQSSEAEELDNEAASGRMHSSWWFKLPFNFYRDFGTTKPGELVVLFLCDGVKFDAASVPILATDRPKGTSVVAVQSKFDAGKTSKTWTEDAASSSTFC